MNYFIRLNIIREIDDLSEQKRRDLTDLAEIATLVVASTALVTAVGTLWQGRSASKTVAQNQKTLKLLYYQTAFQRLEQEPRLEVKEFKFVANKLLLTLVNSGKGTASWIGVQSRFTPARFIPLSEDRRLLTRDQVVAKAKAGEKIQGRFEIDSSQRLHFKEWSDIKPRSAVTFLVNEQIWDSSLRPAQEATFEVDIRFKLDLTKTRFWGMTYDQLKDVIEENHLKFSSFSFMTICKDSTGNPVDGEQLCNFVMIFGEHSDFEAAYKDNHQVISTAGEREVPKAIGWMDSEMYRKGRYPRNLPDPPEMWDTE